MQDARSSTASAVRTGAVAAGAKLRSVHRTISKHDSQCATMPHASNRMPVTHAVVCTLVRVSVRSSVQERVRAWGLHALMLDGRTVFNWLTPTLSYTRCGSLDQAHAVGTRLACLAARRTHATLQCMVLVAPTSACVPSIFAVSASLQHARGVVAACDLGRAGFHLRRVLTQYVEHRHLDLLHVGPCTKPLCATCCSVHALRQPI